MLLLWPWLRLRRRRRSGLWLLYRLLRRQLWLTLLLRLLRRGILDKEGGRARRVADGLLGAALHLADPLHSLLLHPLQLLRGVSLFFPLHWLSPPSANRPLSVRAGSSWISCMMRMASSTFLARRGESSGRIARSRSMLGLERERACIVR